MSRSWALAAREADGASVLAAKLSKTQALAADQDRRARDEQTEADRLTAEHTAREQALGTTGEELRRRYAVVVSELKSARETHRHATTESQAALVAAAALERDAVASAGEHDGARAQREESSRAFAQLARGGIMQLALGDAAPADADRPHAWTFTRTLEVVRALPDELLSVRSSAGALAVEVGRNVQLLDRELAEADMGAYASRGEDGLLLVRVTETGSEQTLAEVLDTLDAEIADREQILTAEERRVFSDALVEEIADHLRQRMHEVRGRVEQMNAVLRRSPTAAGKVVELEWQPLDDDEGMQRTALALLRRDVHRPERRVADRAGHVLPAADRGRPPRACLRRRAATDGGYADGRVRLPAVVRVRSSRAQRCGPRAANQAPSRRRLGRRAVGADPSAAVRRRSSALWGLAGRPGS